MDRRGSLLALLTGAAAALTGRRVTAAGGKKYRAVFDLTVDTPEKWDAAVAELIRKQDASWAYLKVGR